MTVRPRNRYARRLKSSRDDSGAILIIALIITTVIAVVVSALLTRGDGSLRATVQLRQVAGSTYAADGAAQVAINALRSGYNPRGVTPWSYTNALIPSTVVREGCFGWSGANQPVDSMLLSDFYPAPTSSGNGATSAVVTCEAELDTGDAGPLVPINNQNKPGYAIVTLGGNVDASGSNDPGLLVKGGIYANGNVLGKVNVLAGGIRATGSCSGAQVVGSPKNCPAGAPVVDPNYAAEITSVPDWRKAPTACTSGVAIFEPGYYDSASDLNTATNLCGTLWFKPGNYYFDFHNDACANVCPSGLFGTAGNEWTINNKKIVAGTPIGGGSLPSNPTIPGACDSPIDNVNAQGVQFVFGGSSRFYVDQNSDIEFCGSYHNDRPPIVVYGLKNGSTPTSSSLAGMTPSSVVETGGFTNATALRVATADGGQPVDLTKVATWTNSSSGDQTTTVSLKGYTPGAAIPPGSIVTGASVNVTHADGASRPSASIAVKVDGSSTNTAAFTLPTHAANSTDGGASGVPLTGDTLADLQKQVREFGYSGATIDYVAGMRNAGTAHLDAIRLSLTYYTPVLRGQSGTCIASGSCRFINMKQGNAKNQIYFQGTTYVPLGNIRLLIGNFSNEIMKFGLISNSLEFAFWNGNSVQDQPVIEIPDNSPGFGVKSTIVQLKVYVCPSSPTCSASGTPALTSRVQLWAPTGGANGGEVKNKRAVRVLSWSHPR
ncbi:hypothetical protein ACFQ0K_02290 [Nocardioides caeni]|uniref:Uncharacterized protein n=1 Tax=Nocardioides caeni TaxID=574700 RepID=A0A4S8NP41_9ACTN|nr:hypothetical protein [Nocardioides caeni]THV18335.1 hypothetical protein E9934_01480 [Nocardioides caeni]